MKKSAQGIVRRTRGRGNGESGANTLDGGDGNDILNSGGPGSSLFGGAGNDDLSAWGNGNYLDGGDALISARWRCRMHAAQHWRDAANDAAEIWRAAA